MSLFKQSTPNHSIDAIPGPEEEPSSLSLMGGVAGRPDGLPEVDFDLDSMKARRQKISQGSLIILLVVVIAAGSLYAMRLTQGDLAIDGVSSDVMKKIETALARSKASTGDLGGQVTPVRSTFRDTESIVRMFNADVSQRQVPIEYVQCNPFAMAVSAKVQAADGNPADAARQRDLIKKLESEFNSFKLQSVMPSARIPVVVIDGQFYKEGQKVGSFTIVKIHDRGVDLQADGMTRTLSMQDQAGQQRRR